MDTNAIIAAITQQLVSSVADEVIRKLKIEGLAQAALEPETLKASLQSLMTDDADVRDSVRDLVDERTNELERRIDNLESNPTCNIDISDNDDFTDLKSTVDDLVCKLEDLETINHIDADDDDFQDAVRSVIRNHI